MKKPFGIQGVFIFAIVFVFSLQVTIEATARDAVTNVQTSTNLKNTNGPIEVTFISNCGFLINIQGKKILVDIEEPGKAFDKASVSTVYEKLFSNTAPFNDIDAVLISHPHSDHVGMNELLAYLQQNPTVQLFAAENTVADLQKTNPSLFTEVNSSIIMIDPFTTNFVEKTINGISITFIGCWHAGAPAYVLKDLCFVIETGGIRIFYMSDIDPTYEKNLAVLSEWKMKKKPVDLLFTPDINLYDNDWVKKGNEVINSAIVPKTVIAMHIDPNAMDEAEKKIKVNYPDGIVFRTCMEKRTITVIR